MAHWLPRVTLNHSMLVRREFKHHQGSRKKLTLIAQYWLVLGTDLSVS